MKDISDSQIDLKDYRQPLVTSLGVIFGFILGFLGQWVTEDTFSLNSIGDEITFVGCILGALLLITALFRMLFPHSPMEATQFFYRRTLWIYMAGVLIPFCSIVISAFI